MPTQSKDEISKRLDDLTKDIDKWPVDHKDKYIAQVLAKLLGQLIDVLVDIRNEIGGLGAK